MTLNQDKISEQLRQNGFSSPFNLHVLQTVDSTNRYLKDLPVSSHIEICCAEMQTQGRGRFGRHWHSPFGENMYCSSRWNMSGDPALLSGLSLITSLGIMEVLQRFNPSGAIKIKWPNDILWGEKKLCGSLVELIVGANGTISVIIGIGLNVNTDTKNQFLPDKPWVSLYELSGQYQDRNLIIAEVLISLERCLNQLLDQSFSSFMASWERYDYLINQHVSVTHASKVVKGIAKGINASGQLILEDEHGKRMFLSSGDTSLRLG